MTVYKPTNLLLLTLTLFTLTLAFTLLPNHPASATNPLTFTVTSPLDAPDNNPGDGLCASTLTNNPCTLRAAIQESNANAGPDTINLAATTYTLTIAGTSENEAATGDLDIYDTLTIQGAGQNSTIIDGNALDRVFQVNLPGDNPYPSPNNLTAIGSDVNVIINDLTIRNGYIDQPKWGSAIAQYSGATTLNRTHVTANVAVDDSHIFDQNIIYNNGHFTVIDTIIDDNQAKAIYNSGTFDLRNTTINNNDEGIHNNGIMTITHSTIINTQYNEAIYNGKFGGRLTIDQSLIANNNGRGIYSFHQLYITNSTITGNHDEGIFLQNNYREGFETILHHNTIINNRIGLTTKHTISPIVSNNIIAHNSEHNCYTPQNPPVYPHSLGHNLSNNNDCSFQTPTDITYTDPLLGPLQDNGGPTHTYALLPNSLALEHGNCANGTIIADQRGVSRPQGTHCDIGAYEFNDAPFLIAADDHYNVPANNTFTMPAPGILLNDTAFDTTAPTISLITPPTVGTLNLNANGGFDYTPPANFTGSVTFVYEISADALTDQATVTLDIQIAKCWATFDNGATVFAAPDIFAVHQALNQAPANSTIKIAGHCAGTFFESGLHQSIYLKEIPSLTLQGGYTVTNWTTPHPDLHTTQISAEGNGRVFRIEDSTVTLENLHLINGQIEATVNGSALHALNSTVTLSNVTIADNFNENADIFFDHTTWTINNSTLHNNGSGALLITRYSPGTINHTSFTNSGTIIHYHDTLTLNHVSFHQYNYRALYNSAIMHVNNAQFSTTNEAIRNWGSFTLNNAHLIGAATSNGIANRENMTITNSTIENYETGLSNRTDDDEHIYIGNSTITNNQIGIDVTIGEAVLESSTITHNDLNIDAGGNGALLLNHSIIAYAINGVNCDGYITSAGYNISDDDSCFLFHPQDLPNTDPLLDPLTTTPIPTYPLQTNSPAIGTAPCLPHLPTDQTGTPRPQGTNCDRGAHEYTGTPFLNLQDSSYQTSQNVPLLVDTPGLLTNIPHYITNPQFAVVTPPTHGDR
ncbi:MAG TPA: choice-of-anchor Q domain-containing protein, partial [Anaerolineae bacterium]|nr:choice-of-anchor Q domain-containing protein [Anaerolineae bacterium]